VFDSIAATVWHSLMLTDRPAAVHGYGDLLANGQPACQDAVGDPTIYEAATGADRTTLRVDLPDAGCSVNTCRAESCGPTAGRYAGTALPQRDLETVRWIDRHRALLVQPDFTADPHPPRALLEVYGVQAQMLAPAFATVKWSGGCRCTSLTERPWSVADSGHWARSRWRRSKKRSKSPRACAAHHGGDLT